MSNEMTKVSKYEILKTRLEENAAAIRSALPKVIDCERFVRIACTTLRQTPDLWGCHPASVVGSVLEAAQVGLEVDGVLGHAYLIPFKGECQLVPGYRGLLQLVRRSGEVRDVTLECVRDGDGFEWQMGDEPFIHHRPNISDQDRFQRLITWVYAVVRTKDGGKYVNVMSAKEIDAHKEAYSAGHKKASSPWKTAWPRMAEKTALRGLFNVLPVSVEAQRLAAREDFIEHVTAHPATVSDVSPKALSSEIGPEDLLGEENQELKEE